MFNFHKNSPAKKQDKPLSPHLALIEDAIQKKDQDKLLDGVFAIIKENSMIYTIGDQESDGRISLGHTSLKGENYLILLTSPEHFKNDGINNLIACKHISQILDPIFGRASKCGGLAINPFTDGYFLFKNQISSMIEAARKGTWGHGIPTYSQCDIMTQEDLLSFACETLVENILPKHQIITQEVKQVAPRASYIIGHQGQTPIHIVVQSAIAPTIPKLTPALRSKIIENANRAGAKCFYASLSFGSTDANRFENSLALRGDAYHCRFTGLEEIL